MPRRPFFFAVLLLTLAAGCERASDPSVVEEERRLAARGVPNTLPVLFEEALRAAQRRHGAEAVERALTAWQAKQADVQNAHSAGDPAVVQAKLQALRNEELRFVIGVLGPQVINRVLSESMVSLVNARVRLLEASQQGAQTTAAEAGLQEINQKLSQVTALAAREPVRALAMATEAAQLLAGIDDAIVELRRLRGVETLFPEIAGRLKAEELRTHVRLQSDAHAALRSGQRQLASQKLAAVRNEEIRLVLAATHGRASAQLLQQIAGSIGELRQSLEIVKATGGDAVRRERMLATAQDFYQQAREAEARGDRIKALDLGSHAAGLLNALRHLLVR